MMRKLFFVILISLTLAGCELIVIGIRQPTTDKLFVDYSRNSAIGTIFLFKAELDSNNVPAASDYFIKPDGNYYSAYEKYEKFYDIFRVKRMISATEITEVKTDTLTNSKFKYKLEFDYRRKLFFTAIKIENSWYISEVENYD